MDKDDLQLVLLGLGTLGTFILIFINLPQAINRWSPIFNSLSPAVLGWTQNFLIAGFAFATGWLLKSKLTSSEPSLEVETDADGVPIQEAEDKTPSIDKIVGCVAVDEMAWRGIAEFSDVKIEDVDVELTPRCPDCQKEMTRESYELPTGRGGNPYKSPLRGQSTVTRKRWQCPDEDCGYTADRESGQHSEAQRLFKGFVQDIVESEGQEYSLDNLIERVEGDVTPQKVWEEYAEVIDNIHVSTNCFR
jgi:hypothetical protein